MWKLAAFLLIAGIASQTLDARDTPHHSNIFKRVTVQQMEQVLSSASGQKDKDIAREIYTRELTERFSTVRVLRWQAQLPGPKSRQALCALADKSAFLDLPVAEIPNKTSPDIATQKRILSLTAEYVNKTIHQLPNFSATRVTTNFEDGPRQYDTYFQDPSSQKNSGNEDNRAGPLYPTGTYKSIIRYRKGQEVLNTGVFRSESSPDALTSSGEFGSIIGMVMLDSGKSVTWSHWEQGATGMEAVFHYTVPAGQSHFELYCRCFDTPSNTTVEYGQSSPYHGEVAVDPLNGTILRLTVQADLKPSDPFLEAGIAVEYGPVQIGEKTYICPVKSTALSLEWWFCPDQEKKRRDFKALQAGKIPRTSVNDVVFQQYHVFRSHSRVLTQE